MDDLLSQIESPADLRRLDDNQLLQLAAEMREALCNLVSQRTAHFASNLGVVELCLALHLVFDFRRDRLIWDTGHQIYPHKLVTGRYDRFDTMRTKGGLMGYPNPAESPYDLFMTGHAGASVSCGLGLKTADDLLGRRANRTVVVIGDGALPSGIVFEAMNNAAGLSKDLLIVLNDNKMSICPRVGGLARYLDRARMMPFYGELKRDVRRLLGKVPVMGDPVAQLLSQAKEGLKASLHGGMLFEELGLRYIGPIDGHDLPLLRQYLTQLKEAPGPVVLHVLTEKGHGFRPASEDPVTFHTPPPFEKREEQILSIKKSSSRAYTNAASEAILASLQKDPRVAVITAAMCQGNKLEPVRDAFPERFFDTGICESHAVAFAAGLAKAGMRPIAAIYSTFWQRAFDQLFQEVALQNLPVTFCLDRAGLCGPDGPTHHGVFDIVYLRLFPNFVVMAPGDESDLAPMLVQALAHEGPAALRYPKAAVRRVERAVAPVELGQAEVIEWGDDGIILAYGAVLADCIEAAETLRGEGLDVGVVNARFVKPLDTETVLRAVEGCRFVVTVEEGTLEGGFGSAVLEAVNAAHVPSGHVYRLGIPDRFIQHGDRAELLAELGLDAAGIAGTGRDAARRAGLRLGSPGKRVG
ncbi:MAG: 1-deoxy-D-xylulose-5-phosphate synthase [Pirellulales bacterium]